MASETIADIVREMRDWKAEVVKASSYPPDGNEYETLAQTMLKLVWWADRIEAAEAAAKFVTSVAERADRDLAELNAENARLRAALKPVLECDCWILETGKSRATDGGVSAIKAVREAKRIYNESEVK